MADQPLSSPLLSETIGRRPALLRLGGIGSLGLAPTLLAGATPNPIRSCILIYYYGGPSHLDTWDMKPLAPAEVRGEFRAIATRTPGLAISEHLSHCAKITDRLAIIRSMRHGMRNHNSAAVEALCGRTPLRGDLELLADDPNSFPCYGSLLSHTRPARRDTPTHVALPHIMTNVVTLPGQNAGFLGATHEPFQIRRDPSQPGFRVDELDLPADLSVDRLGDRRSLLERVDRHARKADALAGASGAVAHERRAFDLIHSQAVRSALDLSRESAATRDRYGRNTFGQSLLLARRLVEAGVTFINVNDKIQNGQLANWDSHENNFKRLKNDLLPAADLGFSALVEDLTSRGLLASTLVLGMAEFGRTPKINGNGGRDHWPDCYSVVLAGGGIIGGTTYGASDRIGAYPAVDPVTPGDLAATLFWRLGVDPSQIVHDRIGRPYPLADGTPIERLFGS